MSRIIINYPEGMDPRMAIRLVDSVILGGRVSNHKKQYCFATTFKSGAIVYSSLTRAATDTFTVFDPDKG